MQELILDFLPPSHSCRTTSTSKAIEANIDFYNLKVSKLIWSFILYIYIYIYIYIAIFWWCLGFLFLPICSNLICIHPDLYLQSLQSFFDQGLSEMEYKNTTRVKWIFLSMEITIKSRKWLPRVSHALPHFLWPLL